MTEWLPITEYSSKYKVSVSTLRRRIKTGRVEHIYEDGKYLLKNSPLGDHHPNNQKEVRTQVAPPQTTTPDTNEDDNQKAFKNEVEEENPRPKQDGSQFEKFQGELKSLLAELKKAYSLVLQEKEEQVMILKDEVADLQTLVRVLESDNARLKNELNNLKIINQQTLQTAAQPQGIKISNEPGQLLDPEDLLNDGEWVHELELE